MLGKLNKLRLRIIDVLKQNQVLLTTLLYVLVFIDATLLEVKSDVIIFSLLGLYTLFIALYHLTSRITFKFCLALLLLMYVYFLTTGPALHTEKIAVWLVLFMVIGIIQQWRE